MGAHIWIRTVEPSAGRTVGSTYTVWVERSVTLSGVVKRLVLLKLRGWSSVLLKRCG